MSNLSTSKRTLMALRDECDRLCLVARRHDERLRDVVQALEAARDVNGSSAEAVRLAERALHSGSQVQEMAQSLLARLEAEAAERTHAGAHPITAVLVVDDIEDARVLIAETLLQAGFLVRTAENRLDALIATCEEQSRAGTQEFTLRAFTLDGEREIVRQQFTFSPPETTIEREEYATNLNAVSRLELVIIPAIDGGNAVGHIEGMANRLKRAHAGPLKSSLAT